MSGTRATKSGFAAEAQAAINAKYSVEFATDVMDWVSKRLQGTDCPVQANGDAEYVYQQLCDGYALNVLLKQLEPYLGQSVKTPTRQKMAFKKMEQISNFLAVIEKAGVPKMELFQTVDLYEKQNMTMVIMTLAAFGRKIQAKGGPGFGPKEAQENKRDFSEEQMKAGQSVIGLQMGSNKGATQAGQSFGKSRMIVD